MSLPQCFSSVSPLSLLFLALPFSFSFGAAAALPRSRQGSSCGRGSAACKVRPAYDGSAALGRAYMCVPARSSSFPYLSDWQGEEALSGCPALQAVFLREGGTPLWGERRASAAPAASLTVCRPVTAVGAQRRAAAGLANRLLLLLLLLLRAAYTTTGIARAQGSLSTRREPTRTISAL